MRADFIDACLAYVDLTQAIQTDAVWLGPMSEMELREAIERPAMVQGKQLESGLVELILRDVADEENCLPLLEFALSELWERRSDAGLTLAGYKQLDGVLGAVNQHAEEIYRQLAKQQQEQWVKRVMLRLVRIGEDVRDTRQRQLRSNLLAIGKDNLEKAAIDVVINSLVDGRLLVSDRIEHKDVIDFSHEALIQSWQRFAKWRGENRDMRRLVQRVQDAYKEWSDKGKNDEYLMQGGLLSDVDQYWVALSDILDSPIHNYFYERSKLHSDSKSLRLQYPAIKERLEQQARETSIKLETAPHQAALETIQSIGVSLMKLGGVIIPSIQSNLRTLADAFSQPESYPLEKQPSSYALSPDGKKVAIGYGDGSIQLLNTRGAPLGKPFPAHEKPIYSRKLIFTPDCDTILSSDGREIKFWSLSGDLVGVILDVYERHGSYLNRMVCSPDGKWLVSNDDDGTVCLWGLHDRLWRWTNTEHDSFCVAFSPDSQKIISSGSAPNIQMRNLTGNLSHQGFEEDGCMVIHSVEFSPDGQKIVGGGNDGGIVIWDLSGRRIARAQAHHFVQETEETTSWAKISPNGNIVASFSEDSKLRLWDMDANPIGRPLKFNSGRMGISDEFVFTPDGQQIMMLNDKGITFFLGGTWKDWLEICCNYLRYHPSMNDPDNPIAVEACEVCRKYIWETEDSQPRIPS